MMKRLIIVMAIMTMVGGLVIAEPLNIDAEMEENYSMYYENQTDGAIDAIALPDQETAITVASAIVKNIASAEKMESVYAMFDTDNAAWIVTFAPAAAPNSIGLGEEINIVLSASDCRVLKIWGAE